MGADIVQVGDKLELSYPAIASYRARGFMRAHASQPTDGKASRHDL